MCITGVHFPDLNPYSHDNLNNMKLDLTKCFHQGQIDECKLPGPLV